MTTAAIIQARTGSTRLPGKVMKRLDGKTVLEYGIGRVSQARNLDKVIIATTVKEQDDCIAEAAEKLGVDFFRGDEANVLSRYIGAAKKFGVHKSKVEEWAKINNTHYIRLSAE